MTRYFDYDEVLPCKSGEHEFQMNGRCHRCRHFRKDLINRAVSTLRELAPEMLALEDKTE